MQRNTAWQAAKKLVSIASITCLILAQQGTLCEALAGVVRTSGQAGTGAIPSVPGVHLPLVGNQLAGGMAADFNLKTPGLLAPAPQLILPPAVNLVAPSADAAEQVAAPALAAALAPGASPLVPAADIAAGQGVTVAGVVKFLSALRLQQHGVAAAALRKAYDGAAAKADETDVAAPAPSLNLPSQKVKAILIRHGEKPVVTDLAELPKVLAASGALAQFNTVKTRGGLGSWLHKKLTQLAGRLNGQGRFAKKLREMLKEMTLDKPLGHIRVVLGENNPNKEKLSEADAAGIDQALKSIGLDTTNTRSENLPVNWTPAGGQPAGQAAAKKKVLLQRVIRGAVAIGTGAAYVALFGTGNIFGMLLLMGIVSNVDNIVKESIYVARTLKASFKDTKSPTWNEILFGLVSKVIPAIINLGLFITMYAGHPWALAVIIPFNLAQNIFHGVWADSWNNFQAKISMQRGPVYQNLFNLSYGVLTTSIYRTIAFVALGHVAPPWVWEFWKALAAMLLIGTFIGSLGYLSFNKLYAKGRLPRWGRNSIGQGRDVVNMLIGPFFSTGSMFMSWLIFSIMQSIDLTLAAINWKARTRPIIVIADEQVAKTDEFYKGYVNPPSPIKVALETFENFVLVRPIIMLLRKIGLLRPKKG